MFAQSEGTTRTDLSNGFLSDQVLNKVFELILSDVISEWCSQFLKSKETGKQNLTSSIEPPFFEKLFNIRGMYILYSVVRGNAIQIYKLSQQRSFVATDFIDKQKEY